MTIPRWQQELIENGELYRVGGSVRDRLLGLAGVTDTDYLVRGMEPSRLEAILARHGRLVLAGKVFGVYHFSPREEAPCDIAFPRTERSTGPGHRDFSVQSDWRLGVEEDLGRRDFTVNAMAERIPGGELIDPFGGREDLAARRLRILFPRAFEEDPLRILRGARFAARFGLVPDDATTHAMREAGPLLATVSAERVQEEISRLLTQCDRPAPAFELLLATRGLAAVLPELARAAGVTQNEYHPDDVFRHTLKVCDAAPRTSLVVRWAALLHDLGKVDTRHTIRDAAGSRVVFYGHEVAGAEIAARVLDRLRYPNAFVRRCTHLVREHMFRYELAWKPATVRRFMSRIGVDHLDDLFALREADCKSRALAEELDLLRNLRERVAAELRERNGVHIDDLEIDGEDVMRVLGVEPGPVVGKVLRHLLERVLETPELNRRAALLEAVREDFGGRKTRGGE